MVANTSSLTITLIDKGLKLKETWTLMREIDWDWQRAVLPSPLISQNRCSGLHVDKLNKRKQPGKAGRIRIGVRRLKDLFYKFFGLVLADGDGRALMKLSGHVKAWWGSPNATLTVAPQPPSHAKYNYSIITSAVQVPAGQTNPPPPTPCLLYSLIPFHPP